MNDNMAKTTVVSGEPHERDGGSNVTYPGRPRRQIKSPRRFIEEDWDNYKPKSISRPTSTKSTPSKLSSTPGSGSQSSKSSETRRRSHLTELRLLQARKEAKARQVEEQRLAEKEGRRAYEEFRRREEKRRLTESRQIREFEYQTERLRLEARLEEEEEWKDLKSLMNHSRDFEDVEREDQRLHKANVQSTPYNQDHPTFLCNGTQTSERGMKEPKEKLNVSWVRKLCNSETSLDPSHVNGGELKSIFPRSLPKLELPSFAGSPLEWPTFISLFKCLVRDQPLSDTQRMTHLQRALDGNAKKAVGGMLTHGHLYREALKELEEQFGNEESVAGAYLKTVLDHPKVSEDNFIQLRSFYNTLHVTVSTLKSLSYEHDLAATDNLRRAVQKLP